MSSKHPERWLVIWWCPFLPIALLVVLLIAYRAYLSGSLPAQPPRWEISVLGLGGLLLAFAARRLRAPDQAVLGKWRLSQRYCRWPFSCYCWLAASLSLA
jgi:hypothetical protein